MSTNFFLSVRSSIVPLQRYNPYTFVPRILYSSVTFLSCGNKKSGRGLASSYKASKHAQRVVSSDQFPPRNVATIQFAIKSL
ncbi:hypothetical protein FBUS_04202 [Fasciolopsis buskii]|uniref:Uncharacterized protein n=1 Tax=Fasciolopsis buskii TaxID=27845 RepID=A0A8E0VFC8_9TREM|nr:hypothetical protein FBUS_04202 [Fasciolopsis buski]